MSRCCVTDRVHGPAAADPVGQRLASVEAILFDATGTLLEIRGSVGAVYSEVGARQGLELEPAAVDRAFPGAFAAAPPLAFPGLEPAERDAAERVWWRGVVERTLEEACAGNVWRGRFERFFDEVYRTFAGPRPWRVAAGAARVLNALSARGYALGVLSNSDGRLPGLLAALGVARYFAAVATSSSLGVAKPDPRAFRSAVELLGCEPDRAAYVGDSPERDGRGAAAAGLLAVIVGSSPPDLPTLTVARVRDLVALFPDRRPRVT